VELKSLPGTCSHHDEVAGAKPDACAAAARQKHCNSRWQALKAGRGFLGVKIRQEPVEERLEPRIAL
jgi:hypothetical protein